MGGRWHRISRRTYFSTEKGMRTMNWIQVSFVHKRIMSAVKRDELDSDRVSYIIL
jgi:hypothetical protein